MSAFPKTVFDKAGDASRFNKLFKTENFVVFSDVEKKIVRESEDAFQPLKALQKTNGQISSEEKIFKEPKDEFFQKTKYWTSFNFQTFLREAKDGFSQKKNHQRAKGRVSTF